MRLDEAILAAGKGGVIRRSWMREVVVPVTSDYTIADLLATDWEVVPPEPPKPREWTLHAIRWALKTRDWRSK